MSDALESARAVAAIPATLAERMAAILRTVPDIERKGARYAAYQAGGIELAQLAIDETHDADVVALSSEMMRRLTQC